jgi:hypothetical protein
MLSKIRQQLKPSSETLVVLTPLLSLVFARIDSSDQPSVLRDVVNNFWVDTFAKAESLEIAPGLVDDLRILHKSIGTHVPGLMETQTTTGMIGSPDKLSSTVFTAPPPAQGPQISPTQLNGPFFPAVNMIDTDASRDVEQKIPLSILQ